MESKHPPTSSSSLSLKSGGLFIAANLLAGFFHYLYQALASRQLPLQEFANLNAWFATLAIFLAIPTLLQYWANFNPGRSTQLRLTLIVLNALMLVLLNVFYTFAGSLDIRSAILILSAASIFGWLSGQAQNRLLFGVLSGALLLVGVFKVLTLGLPIGPQLINSYSLALIACYLPAIWWLTYKLWTAEPAHYLGPMNWRRWTAPAILSLAVAAFPQMDLVLLHSILDPQTYAQFTLSSLFYKGIFFVVYAYLQWLLPQQMRRAHKAQSLSVLVKVLGLSLILSTMAAALGPWAGAWILKWQTTPPPSMIFLSCLNTCLLTWILVTIQSQCAVGHIGRALVTLFVISAELGLQLFLHFEVTGYFVLSLIIQSALILGLSLGSGRATKNGATKNSVSV